MCSDPANNDGQVPTDSAQVDAKTSASTSSAMEPHTGDDSDSAEDEVVWKGRPKGRIIQGAQHPAHRLSDPQQRQSEARGKRVAAPSYYPPPPYHNFYPSYPQTTWPYLPAYPLAYPPAYPRFHALPYTVHTLRAPNHHMQHNPQPKNQSNAVHPDGKSGYDAAITHNTQPGIKKANHLRQTKTPAKKLKTMRVTPASERKVRAKVELNRHKKLPSALPDPVRLIDKVYTREGSSNAKIKGPNRPQVTDQAQSDEALSQRHLSHSQPIPRSRSAESALNFSVTRYNGSRGYPIYPNSIRRVSSEPSFAAQKSAYFVPPHSAFPTSMLAHPLDTARCAPSDRDAGSKSINSRYANGKKSVHIVTENMPAAAGDVSATRSLSQQASEPELDNQIARRARQFNLDGLIISVTVQSSDAAFHSQFSIPSEMKWPDRATIDKGIRMDVRKVFSAKRLRRRDGSYSMELYCDEGPSSSQKDGGYQIQWLHMQTHRLNLTDFENACLNAPGVSGKTRFVLLRLLRQIQIKHRKQLFDGYSIEPGTVLRYDGISSGDPDLTQPSAIFMCFPYLSIGMRQQDVDSTELGYPTRSILQTLYPYESTKFREEPPSFCSDLPQESGRALYVPQCWIVILNSDIVISCAELGSVDIMDPAVSLSHRKKYFPPVTGHQSQDSQWPRRTTQKESAAATPDSMNSAQALSQSRTDTDAYNRNFLQLFEGIRVEDYLIEDDDSDDSDASSMTSSSESSLETMELTKPSKTRDHIVSRQLTMTDSPNDAVCSLALDHSFEGLNTFNTPSFAVESPPSDPDLETLHTAGPLHDSDKSQLERLSLTVEEATKAEESMLALLKSLESPQMTTKYLSEFKMYMSDILRLWDSAPPDARRRQLEILTRLQEGIARAELLRSMCDLESQGTVFSENLEYRDAMLKALGIENSSSQKEIESLGAVVRDAMTLFNGISDSNTSAVIKLAKKTLQRQEKVAKTVVSENLQSSELAPGSVLESIKPFLTWTSVNAELDQDVNLEHVAAEYLHAIMREIEQSLSRRNEKSYEFARELTISDLEYSLLAPTPHLSTLTSNIVATSPQGTPNRSGPWITTSQVLSSFGTMSENFPLEDPVLRGQNSVVRTAIDDLFACLKHFVGLYVPCNYPHAVCHKMWGSMALLNTSVTLLFRDDEHTRLLYIIRPLEAGFIRTHKIEKPTISIESCSACRDGQIYKSHQEAMNHINRAHYGEISVSRSSRYQQTVRRYYVRTENDVRNERANKQQLRLLQICIGYFKLLVTRGEKLHSGINNGEHTDHRRYQLPDGLVDCFEETALFLMQATTSVVAIRNETGVWKHVPGKAIDDLETPAVQSELEKLGKLGESAQASMTKAEKALALAGLDESMVSMGSAGPELLVSIILQNIGKRNPLEEVKMDVNQLYQEYTSKLQYQINQFPRKRLLRSIHKLQEELTVVRLVNSWQQKTFNSFLQVLNPQTYEAPTPERINQYTPESECIGDSLKSLKTKAVELEALENRTQYLREQLKQSVEILEEDHGKAILVFTMITTIFLPLSFITSFFGMNMSDIRNTDSTQAFFWAIAIPVTAGIVFVAVLLAYRGDKWYDAVVQAIHEVKEQRRRKNVQTAPLQNGRKWRDLLSFALPSWTLRKPGHVKTEGVELDILKQAHNIRSAVVT